MDERQPAHPHRHLRHRALRLRRHVPATATSPSRFTKSGRTATTARSTPASSGEIDVRRVILDSLPTAAVPVGDASSSPAAPPTPTQPVEIQLDGRPGGSRRSRRDARRRRHLARRPSRPGDRRLPAPIRHDVSETRRLLVSIRRVHLPRHAQRRRASPSRRALPTHASSSSVDLRERFGWWPVRRTRLDYVSQAELRRPASGARAGRPRRQGRLDRPRDEPRRRPRRH